MGCRCRIDKSLKLHNTCSVHQEIVSLSRMNDFLTENVTKNDETEREEEKDEATTEDDEYTRDSTIDVGRGDGIPPTQKLDFNPVSRICTNYFFLNMSFLQEVFIYFEIIFSLRFFHLYYFLHV